MITIETLVGKSIDAPETREFLDAVDPQVAFLEESGNIHWESHRGGLAVSAEGPSRRISTLFIYTEGVDEFAAFRGRLPDGIDLSMSRAALLAALGPANISGDRHDKWQRGGYSIIAQFKKSGPLRTIALASY